MYFKLTYFSIGNNISKFHYTYISILSIFQLNYTNWDSGEPNNAGQYDGGWPESKMCFILEEVFIITLCNPL